MYNDFYGPNGSILFIDLEILKTYLHLPLK